jgi:dUTP pyrophosphatase
MLTVKIINKSKHPAPRHETEHAAGADLRANLKQPITLKPLERYAVPTGLFFEIPVGYEAQIRPRSGLAYKKGLTMVNAPGTIDADYRGEVHVLLINLSQAEVVIEDGERVAQIVIAQHERLQFEETDKLSDTARGGGGFGSTGRI